MKTKNILFSIDTMAMVFTSCKKEGCTDSTADNYDVEADVDNNTCIYPEEQAPSVYNFSNVSYTGQTVRLLLLQALEAKMEEAVTGHVTEAELLAIYENTAGLYADVATDKNLSGKADANADTQVRAWFTAIDTLSSAGMGYTTPNNLDLKQLVGKTLMGGVFFDQALDNYLAVVPNDDNSTVTDGKGTDMEHHFDEAFGYFGAMRTYNDHTDDENKSPGESDANSDGSIDPTSEKNFYFSITAVKRDLNTASLSGSDVTDYSKDLFDAFLNARYAISNNEYGDRDAAMEVIKESWQKIIAATAVHYINDFTVDVNGGASQVDINKHWAEMVAYFAILGYYSEATMTPAEIATVLDLMGESPDDFTGNTALLTNLETAKASIKTAYGFTDAQANAF